jgi:molybdenum cofactor synthesis domain-containing protein
MKEIRTEDAVGHVLCHDLTRIVKGVEKGAAFRKGHIVTEEDIPQLLAMGKEHLFVWEKNEQMYHENEAAEILRRVCQNENMKASEVKEGKIELSATCDGLFRVDVERLNTINEIDEIMIATRHTNTAVRAGDKLVGTRVIPLVIQKKKMALVEKTAGQTPIAELLPFRPLKAAIVTTGSEVYRGRIADTFTPVVEEKLQEYGMQVFRKTVVGDDRVQITAAIQEMKAAGAEVILCTGGMSVDPDDRTPAAIRDTGARIVTYGAPVLPGAMFLLAYMEDGTPIMGLPGCVMYAKATVFDLVLPRIAAGVPVTKQEIAHMGNGGLCLGCEVCHYPICSFGKGL